MPRQPRVAYGVLTLCQGIEAEDAPHARELRRIFERPFKGSIITLPSAVKGSAA